MNPHLNNMEDYCLGIVILGAITPARISLSKVVQVEGPDQERLKKACINQASKGLKDFAHCWMGVMCTV